MDEKSGSDILKIEDAARYLGVTRRWIYRRIWSGDLPASKVGGLYFIRQQDIEALLKQGELSGSAQAEAKVPEVVLKCGYCFRLLDNDAQIGDVCTAEGCESILCIHCVEGGIHYCANHVPDRSRLWEATLEEYRQGKLPLLVKASQARLREVNFVQRIQTRLSTISTLRHPSTDEMLTVQNWDALLEVGDERAEIMKLMNKAFLETEWLSQVPLNAYALYRLPPTQKQKGLKVAVLAQVLSHSKAMLQKGFDTQPFGVDDLTQYLLKIGEEAQKSQTLTLTMFASTTGWDEAARKLILGEEVGSAFSHHWMLAYLNDMEKHEIIYNRADNRLRGYAELFTSLLPEEEIEEVVNAIEKEMGIYDSMTLQQAGQTLPYSQSVIEKAFAQLAAGGRYALTEVPGIGQAIVRI